MDLGSPKNKRSTLKHLYPDLNDDEYAQIEFNLKRYIQLVWRINQRRDSQRSTLLTEDRGPANVKGPLR